MPHSRENEFYFHRWGDAAAASFGFLQQEREDRKNLYLFFTTCYDAEAHRYYTMLVRDGSGIVYHFLRFQLTYHVCTHMIFTSRLEWQRRKMRRNRKVVFMQSCIGSGRVWKTLQSLFAMLSTRSPQHTQSRCYIIIIMYCIQEIYMREMNRRTASECTVFSLCRTFEVEDTSRRRIKKCQWIDLKQVSVLSLRSSDGF